MKVMVNFNQYNTYIRMISDAITDTSICINTSLILRYVSTTSILTYLYIHTFISTLEINNVDYNEVQLFRSIHT